MEPVTEQFRQVVEQLDLHPPQIPVISTVTGQPASNDITTPEYRVEHVRRSARFAGAVVSATEPGVNQFDEADPDNTLTDLINNIP